MKNINLIFVLIILVSELYGQDLRGKTTIGGNIYYSSGTSTSDWDRKSSSFSVIPIISHFVADDISIGLGLGYGSTMYESEYDFYYLISKSKTTSKSYFINSNVTFYHFWGEGIYFFGQGDFSIGWGKRESDINNDNEKFKTSSISIDIRPGLFYKLNKKIGLELSIGSLGYSKTEEKPEEDYDDVPKTVDENYKASFRFDSITFGARYFLN